MKQHDVYGMLFYEKLQKNYKCPEHGDAPCGWNERPDKLTVQNWCYFMIDPTIPVVACKLNLIL